MQTPEGLKFIIKQHQKFKQHILNQREIFNKQNSTPQVVQKAIQIITDKMQKCKLSSLHPPFFPKTLTKYRSQNFHHIKTIYHQKLKSKDEKQFRDGLVYLKSFVYNFDWEHFDGYQEQIRQPYIRKIYSENYEFDKINFIDINNEYHLRAQIQNLTYNASEWLICIEETQDLLERAELYLDICAPVVFEKMKKEKTSEKSSWMQSFNTMIGKLTSYVLRKGSKAVSSTFFSTMAPSLAILTFAIIGGSASLPFPSDINGSLLITPLMAITVPFVLDNLAEVVEKKQYFKMLEELAVNFEKLATEIRKFNEQFTETMLNCINARSIEQFEKEKLNLEKYVKTIEKNVKNVTDFDEQKFQQMRDRTQAYFQKYKETKEDQWTVVIPIQYEDEEKEAKEK